jgi:hypothetical protein
MNFEETAMWQRLSDGDANYYTKAAEPEREQFRIWIRGLLQTGKITVEFEKADGTDRAMVCTLSEELGAKYIVNENKENQSETKSKKKNNDVCPVWDCTQNAWRSFRWDRLKRIECKIV